MKFFNHFGLYYMNAIKLFIVFLLITNSVFCQSMKDYNDVVATEYEFINAAKAIGINKSFIEYSAEDGILFTPYPSNAKKYYSERKESSAILDWAPIYVGCSQSGDLAFSTGYWNIKLKETDTTEIANGTFATVWQKQKDGRWKFAIDKGVSHPKPSQEIKFIDNETVSEIIPVNNFIEYSQYNEMIELEKELAGEIKNKSYTTLIEPYLFDDSRILRENNLPIVGIKEALKYYKTENLNFMLIPEAGKISGAGDFGFTYGLARINDNTDGEEYSYFHIWVKQNEKWKLLLDLTTPINSN